MVSNRLKKISVLINSYSTQPSKLNLQVGIHYTHPLKTIPRKTLMKFEIYCDEANPDVLTSSRPKAKYLMIGSLWLPASQRAPLKLKIQELKQKHNAWGEIKWSKISPSRLQFYLALVDLFISLEKDLRFRCIIVDHSKINIKFNDNDRELGFYKFYYQLLHHWILDFNDYSIFCDIKTNRDGKRLPDLLKYLSYSNITSKIDNIQFLPSKDVAIIQFCDLLLGATSSKLNKTLKQGTAKADVVKRLEEKLNRPLLSTNKTEEKFNIFEIQLQGGW